MDLVRRGGFIDTVLSPSVGSYLSLNSARFKRGRGPVCPPPLLLVLNARILKSHKGLSCQLWVRRADGVEL